MKGHFQKSIIGALCNSLVSLACIFIFARHIMFLPPKKAAKAVTLFWWWLWMLMHILKASINVGVLRCSSFMFLLLNPQSSWPVYLHAKVFTVTTCFFKTEGWVKIFSLLTNIMPHPVICVFTLSLSSKTCNSALMHWWKMKTMANFLQILWGLDPWYYSALKLCGQTC